MTIVVDVRTIDRAHLRSKLGLEAGEVQLRCRSAIDAIAFVVLRTAPQERQTAVQLQANQTACDWYLFMRLIWRISTGPSDHARMC